MRGSHIVHPDDRVAQQMRLLDMPGVASKTTYDPWPKIYNDIDNFRRILRTTPSNLGLDYEFNINNLKPTIVGVASETECAAIPTTTEIINEIHDEALRRDLCLIAYSTAGADKPVQDKAIGRELPLRYWGDGMITHYLRNQDFCKSSEKGEDDPGALGLMNLWTATSITTNVSQWKVCRGPVCIGPCPTHRVLDYCAIDSWGGLVSHLVNWKALVARGVTQEFYNEQIKLSMACEEMKQRGLRVDMNYVRKADADMVLKKDQLFVHALDDFGQPTSNYAWFNPQAPIQGVKWFGERGVRLVAGDKKSVKAALIKLARKHGYPVGKSGKNMNALAFADDPLPQELHVLYQWHLWKGVGKGLSPWFSEKSVRDGFAHPRFISTGTSTGRLSSSGPNFHNIPVAGWGELIRRAIISRQRGYRILKADFGQMELRMCLHYAGVDLTKIEGDAFTWLVAQAPADFDKAAAWIGGGATPRGVAKSISHAGDYFEGIKMLHGWELSTAYTKRQIDNGALVVYLKKYGAPFDWEFRGKVVCFTGTNLAERFFGDATWENRAKALKIQEDVYFARFPMLRQWHRKLLAEIEDRGYVQSVTGRFRDLYEAPEDDAKIAAAFKGQGTSADVMHEKLVLYWEAGQTPILQVHDELNWEIHPDWSDRRINDHLEMMRAPAINVPGFVCPVKAVIGKNWCEGEMRGVEAPNSTP